MPIANLFGASEFFSSPLGFISSTFSSLMMSS